MNKNDSYDSNDAFGFFFVLFPFHVHNNVIYVNQKLSITLKVNG